MLSLSNSNKWKVKCIQKIGREFFKWVLELILCINAIPWISEECWFSRVGGAAARLRVWGARAAARLRVGGTRAAARLAGGRRSVQAPARIVNPELDHAQINDGSKVYITND